MNKLAVKHPVTFEIVLIIAGFALALVCSIAGQILGSSDNEFNISIGRILAGLFLLIIFHRCINWRMQFSGLLITLPALLFAVWNIANHFFSHGDFAPLSIEIIILGLAPAIFEEIIFRGVFIHNLKASGKSDIMALIISAALFGLIHLTNAVSGEVLQSLIQTGYAVVIGLVFGAIYIRSKDLLSLIIAHAAIDITNRVFMGSSNTSIPVLILFIVLLVVEAAYAIRLVTKEGS